MHQLSYIYCISNPSFPGLLKIAVSKCDPVDICKNMNAYVPYPFKIEMATLVADAHVKMEALNQALLNYHSIFVHLSNTLCNKLLKSLKLLFTSLTINTS